MTDLTGVQEAAIPTQQQHGGDVFPWIVEAETSSEGADGAAAWVAAHRDHLVERCEQHGAVLFRGFDLKDAQDFDHFIRAFRLPNFTYAQSFSNAVRVNRTELVFTANEAPPDVSIHFHHEMAQTPFFPSKLFFFCERAPTERGATPLLRSDTLLERLRARRPEFVERCEKLGIRYTNTMPAEDDALSGQGRSWVGTLGAPDREAAEARLGSMGYSWKWLDGDALSVTTPVLPAVRILKDGRKVFFNQLIAAYLGWAEASKSVFFGDGSPMDPGGMADAVELSEELAFDLDWQTGDVAFIDNFTVMHGRRPFAGKRAVLAALVADNGARWQ